MRILATAGGLPTTIVENTQPWEWMGVLQLLSDPGQVRFIEVDGFGGNFFHANLNSATGLIFITPHARLDYEWFTAAGRAPVVDFDLRFFMTDGTQARSASSFTVQVLDIDDTPPQALVFSSGGSVQAGVPGATIGQFLVTDPDTPSGHSFRLLDGDSWQFEVVGNELRLRPGVQLVLGDGPQRNLIVEVSDGTQSAAFQLSIDILPDPVVGTEPVEMLVPGIEKQGMLWVGEVGVRSALRSWEVESFSRVGDLMKVETRGRGEVWFDKPQWIDLTDGYIDFNPAGDAARTWLAYETMYDRAPRFSEMQGAVHHTQFRGGTEFDMINRMLTHGAEAAALQRLDNTAFVREIYANSVSYTMPDSTIIWHTGRLNSGVTTRAEFVKNIMDWRSGHADFRAEAADGFFVPRAHMTEMAVLLQVGAGMPLHLFSGSWYFRLDGFQATLRDLGAEVLTTPHYQARYGPMTPHEFVTNFYLDSVGEPYNPAHATIWANAIADGSFTRQDFMVAVATHLPWDSPIRTLPQGTMFDGVW